MIGNRQDAHNFSTRIGTAIILMLAAACWAAPLPAEPQQDTSSPKTKPNPLQIIKRPFARLEPLPPPPESKETGEDLCDWNLANQPLQERSREVLRSWSCHSFRWFDGLWGDRHDFNERAVNGLMTLGAEYTEYDSLDPKFRFRVRAPLPNLSRRWDLILGRVDEEAFVSDTQGQDSTFYNPGVVDRGEDEEWLLGLGHRGTERKSGWDYSAGVRLRVPPRPYVKAQWYYNKVFSERSDFRFRQTFFWRVDQGFGTTSRGDMAVSLDDQNVLRWEGIGTVHEETHGVQWYFGQTWYRIVPHRGAFSLRAYAEGQTDWEVPMREYGVQLIWRQPFTREWLYLSLGPRISWPRDFLEQERDLSLGFGVWLEMEFGEWNW